MLRGVLRPPLHVRADRRRRRVQDRHLVALDDVPPAVLVREVRRPLVEDARRAVAERPVDDVAVARHPADVGRAPVDVSLRLQVEDVVVRRRDADEIPRGRVRDPLRLRGRSARVEQVEEILGVHRLARTRRRIRRLTVHELVPCDVAAGRHRHVSACPLPDDDRTHAGARLERLVRVSLQRHDRPAPEALVLREEHLAAHVVQSVGQRLGREPAEDHRVRRAEPRAREHRDRETRPHPHVDPDRRPLSDPERPEPVGRAHDLVEQLLVRDLRPLGIVPRGLALVVVGDPIAETRLDVAVEAVVRDVQLPASVPARVRELPFEERRERLEPRDPLTALPLPELLERNVVDLRLRVRLRCELRRRRIAPVLLEQRLDRLVAHGRRS